MKKLYNIYDYKKELYVGVKRFRKPKSNDLFRFRNPATNYDVMWRINAKIGNTLICEIIKVSDLLTEINKEIKINGGKENVNKK